MLGEGPRQAAACHWADLGSRGSPTPVPGTLSGPDRSVVPACCDQIGYRVEHLIGVLLLPYVMVSELKRTL